MWLSLQGCLYDEKYSKPVSLYRGENALYKFLEKQTVKTYFNKPIKMTRKDTENFNNADKWINIIYVTKSTRKQKYE